MRKSLKSLGLTGILALGSLIPQGCETPSQGNGDNSGLEEVLLGVGLLGLGVNASASGVASRVTAGQAAQAMGGGLVQYGSAKAGKSDVNQNVNVYPNGQQGQETQSQHSNGSQEFFKQMNIAKKDGIYIARWVDKDKDGAMEIGTDIFEETTEFNVEDSVLLMINAPAEILNPTLSLKNVDNPKDYLEKKFSKKQTHELNSFFPYAFQFNLPNSYISGKYQYELTLIGEGANSPYAVKKISVDFDKPKKPGAFTISHPELGEVTAATCNYFEDFDRNNSFGFPEEYIGIKNRFSVNEQISFMFSTARMGKSSDFSLKVLDNSGQEVEIDRTEPTEFEKKVSSKDAEESYGELKVYNPGELTPGTYTGAFSYKERFLGKLEIEVIDK